MMSFALYVANLSSVKKLNCHTVKTKPRADQHNVRPKANIKMRPNKKKTIFSIKKHKKGQH
jgi:hypothetical protein